MPNIDKIEYEKRLRVVQEWIIDDWPYTDIVTQVKQKWGIQERQAKKYISEARKLWSQQEDAVTDQKRRLKVIGLKKLKRSLKEQYKGTPAGIRAIMSVEKELIKLEGLEMPINLRIGGPDGQPLTIPEIKIYNEAPPLASSETDINED